jgi:ADP-heptose:LPS heptosyltransferase
VIFKTDCRHWRGDKPCLENRLCDGCRTYTPLKEKILLIKLGARGDVLRTTPLVAGLRKRYPEAHLTWLTSPEAGELLAGLPGLQRVLAYGPESLAEVMARAFDVVVCLDKEPKATALALLARAPRSLGWGLAPDGTGTPCALTRDADYALALGVSDELKFRGNTKTYLEIIFEAVGLKYAGEPYVLALTDADRAAARKFLKAHRLKPGTKILGLATGCGPAYTRKRWPEERFAALARRVRREWRGAVLLLGGPEDRAGHARIRRLSQGAALAVPGTGTLRELGGFLEACRAVVTGDTLPLHMALALQRPTLALFGPTCPQEIDLFGLGEKVVTPLACAPCYRQTCEEKPTCLEAIGVEDVWRPLAKLWKA